MSDKTIPDKGLAALILIGMILAAMVLMSDISFDIEEEADDNRSIYHGSSETLKKLNEGLPDCGKCVKNCQWTLLKTKEECQQQCIPEETCLEPDFS